jgi:putative ATPase
LKRANRALSEERNLEDIVSDEIIEYLADLADGDGNSRTGLKLIIARNALNMFELSYSLAMTAHQKNEVLTVDTLRPLLLRTQIVYDRAGDKHYDTISAFIKSMRGSDPDAAVYYLARMLKGGEDPLFVARRMVHTTLLSD